jgi:hypothetical protein
MKISEVWWFEELAVYYHIPKESDEMKIVGLNSTSSYENLLDFMILLFIIIFFDIFVTITAMLV